MLKQFNEFQKYLKDKKIEPTIAQFSKHFTNLSLYLIISNTDKNILHINQYYNKTKIIVIDYIQLDQKSTEKYFLICYDLIILILSESQMNLFQTFFTNNKESIITFFKNAKESFDIYVLISNSFEEVDESLESKINSFNEKFKIKPIYGTKVVNFWNKIKHVISAYLIKKSYNNFSTDRISDFFNSDHLKYQDTEYNKDDFIDLSILGSGCSSVQLCYHIEQEKLFAIKTPLFEYIKEQPKLQNREINNYKKISHPFIPKYYGHINSKENKSFVIEYVRGNELNKNFLLKLNDQTKMKIIFELMIVIEYLHMNHFVYRDLRPANVIVDSNGTSILIDYDRMISIANLDQNSDPFTTDLQTIFPAPELGTQVVSYKSDVYSLGVMIYYVFSQNNDFNYYTTIQINDDDFPKKYNKLKNICNRCIELDPSKRPSLSELIDDFYINFYSNIHIHGLFKDESDEYLQMLSESNIIQSKLNIHTIKYFKYWFCISEFNNHSAQIYLQKLYSENNLVPKDIVKELHYQSLVNNQNINITQFNIGKKLCKNIKIKSDITKAIYFFESAARNNFFAAYHELGMIYYEGKFVKKDINKAIYYFLFASSKNIAKSQFLLGCLYYKGELCEFDINKAIHCFNLAANNNFAEAQYNLAVIYYNGYLVERNLEKAIFYCRLAANQDYPMAKLMLEDICKESKKKYDAYSYQNLNNDTFNFPEIYLSSYSNSNSNTYEPPEYKIGQNLEIGNNCQQDINKAIHYYTIAAEKNHSESQYSLGLIYLQKEHKNIDKAIHYLSLSARQNNIKAQNYLGALYCAGKEVKKDYNKAIYFLNHASEKNSAEA